MRTPRRIRRDGEQVAHLALTIDLPGYGRAWSTGCHLVWPMDSRVKDAGLAHALCPACAEYQRRAYAYADAVSVVEQPETPAELRRGQ